MLGPVDLVAIATKRYIVEARTLPVTHHIVLHAAVAVHIGGGWTTTPAIVHKDKDE